MLCLLHPRGGLHGSMKTPWLFQQIGLIECSGQKGHTIHRLTPLSRAIGASEPLNQLPTPVGPRAEHHKYQLSLPIAGCHRLSGPKVSVRQCDIRGGFRSKRSFLQSGSFDSGAVISTEIAVCCLCPAHTRDTPPDVGKSPACATA